MDNKIISYLTLRKAIGILGVILAPVCIMWGLIFTGNIEQSISAYYNTVMRDILVGVLVMSGAFLMSYKGYDLKDNIVSWVSGVTAIGVAFFSLNIPVAHNIFAGLFFFSLAYMSYFQFTLGNKSRRNKVYRICAIVILTGLVSIPLIRFNYSVIIFEAIMLGAFGVSWMLKGKQ